MCVFVCVFEENVQQDFATHKHTDTLTHAHSDTAPRQSEGIQQGDDNDEGRGAECAYSREQPDFLGAAVDLLMTARMASSKMFCACVQT